MEIREIDTKEQWDAFVLDQHPNTFLQSWEWKRVQEQDGEKVYMLGFYDAGELVACTLLILVHARRGSHYLCPHGPLGGDADTDVIQELISFCKNHAAEDGAVALRIAPLFINDENNQNTFRSLGFRPSPMHVHAELTWVLDITATEEELLRGMRKTTRHAIKKATQEGVEVEITTDPNALERFWPLYKQTETRHNFVSFKKEFIASQVKEFGSSNKMYFAIATYQGKDVAAALLFQFADTVFYYHGASVKMPSNISPAQLLQFEAIKEAKRRGATRYNFWGIARDDQKKHPFAGITVFKKGFGGYAMDYLHAQDYVLSWKYWTLWGIEMYRKKKRGF